MYGVSSVNGDALELISIHDQQQLTSNTVCCAVCAIRPRHNIFTIKTCLHNQNTIKTPSKRVDSCVPVLAAMSVSMASLKEHMARFDMERCPIPSLRCVWIGTADPKPSGHFSMDAGEGMSPCCSIRQCSAHSAAGGILTSAPAPDFSPAWVSQHSISMCICPYLWCTRADVVAIHHS